MQPQLVGSSPRITTALIQTMVNQQVTQALLFPTDIAITAIGTDFSNMLQAEAVKDLLDAYERRFNEKRQLELVNRRARICGESYRHIYWNRDKGPLDPIYRKLRAEGKSVTVKLLDGTEFECQRPIYQGDLDEDVLQTWDTGLESKSDISTVGWHVSPLPATDGRASRRLRESPDA
jgi:hypothetical protein